jgi:ornithine cyclodeaminase
VGELSFSEPPGDTHIKYGCINGADHFVIKIASGFYQNPELGLPSNSGLMLVFSSRTGILDTILMDEGYLTDVRTAIAGQIATRYLAPSQIKAIGVLGTGIQARMQVEYLAPVTPCKDLVVWGRTPEKTRQYKQDMEAMGFRVRVAGNPTGVAAEANLIVTTTPAQTPLLFAQEIRPGTHITAMGSDTPVK